MDSNNLIGIIGLGNGGTSLAKVAIEAGFSVIAYDISEDALAACSEKLLLHFYAKDEIEEISEKELAKFNLKFTSAINLKAFTNCQFIFESVTENKIIKKEVYQSIEEFIDSDSIIATLSSTFSINELSSYLKFPERFIGTHFLPQELNARFAEVTTSFLTNNASSEMTNNLLKRLNTQSISVKDEYGKVANQLLAIYLFEAIKILEENLADPATIDWSFKSIGNFEIGPLELLDLLGIDYFWHLFNNLYKESNSQCFMPPHLLKKMFYTNRLGVKAGIGFYDYQSGFVISEPNEDKVLGSKIYYRIMDTLCNAAYNLIGYQKTTSTELDMLVKEGLGFSIGLFEYSKKEIPTQVKERLKALHSLQGNQIYFPSLFF